MSIYCSSVWDLHHLKNIAKLNSIQAFASKVVLQNWSVSKNDRLSTLNWVSLHKRRQIPKLVMCHKIVRNTSLLPSSNFSFLPSVSRPLVIPIIYVYMLLLSKLIISSLSFHLSYLCGTHFLPLHNSLFLIPLSSIFSPIISIIIINT